MKAAYLILAIVLGSAPLWAQGRTPEKKKTPKESSPLQHVKKDVNQVFENVDKGVHKGISATGEGVQKGLSAAAEGVEKAADAVDRGVHKAVDK